MDTNYADVFRDNFDWLKRDQTSLDTLYNSTFREIALEIKKSGALPSPAEANDIFRTLAQDTFSTENFVKFCSALTDIFTESGGSDTVIKAAPQSVIYLRSNVADRAYEHFAEMFPGLSASYGTDFKGICEDVYYERADSCIMPLENSTDGLLMSFRHLSMKYALKITAVCNVRQNDDTLLTLALFTGNECSLAGNTYELYFPSVPQAQIYDIASGIRSVDGITLRINSVKGELGDGCDHHICAEIPSSSVRALFYCFDALYPSYMILGNYYNNNSRKE